MVLAAQQQIVRWSHSSPCKQGANRRSEFELCAWFVGPRGLTLVVAMSQLMQHGLGSFSRADLHARRNPLARQGGFVPQPDGDCQLAGIAAPASSHIAQVFHFVSADCQSSTHPILQ